MEEKKVISLSTLFIIIAVMVIIIMGYLIYKTASEKEKIEEKIENLNIQVSKLENTIYNLQGKTDSNEFTNNNTIENKETNFNNSSTIKIDGTYKLVDRDDLETISYTFSENSVIYESLDSAKGIYKIVGDKIQIIYNVAYGPEGEALDTFPNGQEEELNIIDENTLTSQKVVNGVTYDSKYVKK